MHFDQRKYNIFKSCLCILLSLLSKQTRKKQSVFDRANILFCLIISGFNSHIARYLILYQMVNKGNMKACLRNISIHEKEYYL